MRLYIITSQTSSRAVRDLRDLILDQPLHPLTRTVWWLEYLLRHPHNTNMRSPVHNLAWYQYFLLDVLYFLLAIIAVLAFVFLRCVSVFCVSKKEKKD